MRTTVITERQVQIIKYLREQPNETAKRADLVEKFKHWYYCNGEKHISDILHRMVKSGKLSKPKHGYYKLDFTGTKIKLEDIDPNQLNLL